MIDNEGYRANVGIVITNDKKQILLAKRYKENSWQLPQGGIDKGEDLFDALYRELDEEVGLSKEHVTVLAKTPKWLRYNLPNKYLRPNKKPHYVGQKQVWFLLKLDTSEDKIRLDGHEEIEFDDWKWVDYWSPIDAVISFKKDIYEDMLKALAPVLFENNHHIPSEFSRPLQCTAIRFNN